MNSSKIITAMAIASIVMIGCKKETETAKPEVAVTAAPTTKKPIAAANVQTASFEITGMTCAVGCAKTIEKKLAESEGVEKATVDFDKKLATVSFDKTVQNPTSLTQVIEGVADGKTYKVVQPKS
ncbi:heavy-metal-associated domain-containing protein [Flavobacterium polysaccharolyticum]|uniref:Heavy metal-associated domain-containing protein n=1 Tax=Flavobacterium polysaccharolyticum TaxID=3133148 RepID=A0ABU9NSS9_9FLAO